jgi:hypothetical protein
MMGVYSGKVGIIPLVAWAVVWIKGWVVRGWRMMALPSGFKDAEDCQQKGKPRIYPFTIIVMSSITKTKIPEKIKTCLSVDVRVNIKIW